MRQQGLQVKVHKRKGKSGSGLCCVAARMNVGNMAAVGGVEG